MNTTGPGKSFQIEVLSSAVMNSCTGNHGGKIRVIRHGIGMERVLDTAGIGDLDRPLQQRGPLGGKRAGQGHRKGSVRKQIPAVCRAQITQGCAVQGDTVN